MRLHVMVSRHSAFYSPLIATVTAGFLDDAGLSAEYSILPAGQRSQDVIRNGVVDIMQSAVSSNWKPLERGESPLPVHFALINRRDGFYLSSRGKESAFRWQDLEGRRLLADHGGQPLAMLQYAVHVNGADWSKINLLDRGAPEEMIAAFRRGEGDYIHLQAPAPQLLEAAGAGSIVVSVGASMPEVAFSTLCCSREFAGTDSFRKFVSAFRKGREWARSAIPSEIARAEARLFPGVSETILSQAVEGYQKLGTWSGGIEIPRELYDQALNVFEFVGGIGRRHAWNEVCIQPEV
jgi:NitT/TauT family transport system substrate-binding protein